MQLRYLQSRPVQLYVSILAAMLVFGVVARPIVETLAPDLSVIGIRVVLNWVFVALVVGLVSWLGWWRKVRLTAPIASGGRRYLLVLAALLVVPLGVTLALTPAPFAVPEFTILDGQTLSTAGVVVLVVVGFALGAAVSEELLYRGVVLRSFESRGRIPAALAASVLFGASHLSLLAVGVPLSEVLLVSVLSAVSGIGLAAVAFRLGTLWPLVGWHFLQNSFPAFLTPEAMAVFVPVNVAVVLGVAILGTWLLWTDRNVRVADDEMQADTPTQPTGNRI
ncbi:CPBP family intramembrane glutamic endopeptidase [Halomicroarcula sp. GCM10025324]|uniref:CPBP family intramembrane glutamic endopeptidase n=1 Tax=Halomicroarcula sp. GCM10025324 TaxID=3252667 RepID=UPI00360DBFFD